MIHKTLPLAATIAIALCGCEPSPDPTLVAENQQLKQQQNTQANELQGVKSENDALKNQLVQIQKDIADMKAANAAPPPDPAAAAPAAPIASLPDPAAAPDHGQPLVQTTTSAPTSALRPSGADETETLVPGWIVETFPMKPSRYRDGSTLADASNFTPPEQFSLGSFVNPPSPINLLAHRKGIKGENHVQYQASGYFTVQNRGDHVFVLTMADRSREQDRGGDRATAICKLALALEDQLLVDDYVRVSPSREFSINGGATLIEGLYKTQTTITCSYVGYSSDPELTNLGTINVSIAVRRPGAPSPVELSERDIVYVSQH